MPVILAAAPVAVKPVVFTRSGYSITSTPCVEFHPERDILDTEAASYAAWLAEDDADLWSDGYADEMAERAEMAAMVETCIRF